MLPDISVIVPAFNAEKHLADCLESITGQSMGSWELIIIDDGSSDSTGNIAEEYAAKDIRIKIFRLAKQGVSAARNAGIDIARGKYLAFVDSDDLLEPDYLKELFDKAEESNADITQCSFYFVDEEGNKTPDKVAADKVYGDPDSILRAFFEGAHGYIRDSVWAKLFKRETFTDIRFDTGLSIFEDGYYVYQCCQKATKVISFLTPLYNYVQHGSSTTHTSVNERYKDFFSFSDKLKKEFADNSSIRKKIAGREAETALWLMHILIDNGEKQEAWNLRKRVLGISGDVIWSSAAFAAKLKLIGVTIMPHIYFSLLSKRKNT